MSAKGKSKHTVSKKNSSNLSIQKIEASRFQGPLPHPQILEHYDQIVVGSAERIILMWEKQAQHRQELEKIAIKSDVRQSLLGSIMGFFIAVAAIGSGSFLAYIGRPTEGIVAILTALVGLVGAFGWGTYQRRKERNDRINPSQQNS